MVAIYLHILADTLGSVGVIVSSFFVKYYDWTSADAICSIIISVLIVLSVLPLIRSTLDVLNQRTPVFKETAIRQTLARMTAPENLGGIPGVLGYRHAHFWAFSDSETIGTLHVVCADERVDEQALLARVAELWKDSPAGVANLTVQIEKAAFVNHHSETVPLLKGGQM
jgi:zinc transporter 5/7